MKLSIKYFIAQLTTGNGAVQGETTDEDNNVHTVDVELFTVPSLCLECILPALIPPLCFIHKIPTVYTDSHSRFFFSFKCTEKQIPAILNLSKMVTPSLLKSNLKTLG